MRTSIVLSIASLFSAGLLLASCGSGIARTDSTVAAATSTSAQIEAAGAHLDGLNQSLVNFRGAGAGADLKAIYKSFTDNSGAVNKDITAVSTGASSIEQKARAQLEEWNKQNATIADAELRASSAKRSGDLRVATDALTASNTAFTTIGGDFTTQINDIKKVLDLDLTAAGISNIKPTISKAVDSVTSLRGAFADVAKKAKTISDMLASK